MRRDLCFFFPKPVPEVFNAYMQAIKAVFDKDGSPEPYHTISFGLNFSMRYNMNGGACNLHFMPTQGGTAIDVRYSVAQLAGARYEAHCKAMNTYAENLLRVSAMKYDIDVELFLKPENRVYADMVSAAPAAPAIPAAPARTHKFCTECGTKLALTDRFCSVCGKKQDT